jgi:hypothetical protein
LIGQNVDLDPLSLFPKKESRIVGGIESRRSYSRSTMEWREREEEQPKNDFEEGEGYLYPLPNVVVAVLGADYPAKKGAELSGPPDNRLEMGRIIRPPSGNPPLHKNNQAQKSAPPSD